MVARQQPPDARLRQHCGEEFGGNLALQKPVAVLREARMIPYRVIHPEPDKPPEQGVKGHARQAGGDSTLKLRCHGYGGLGAKSSAAVHCKGARSTAGRIVLRPEDRYQALRLKAHRCAAAGLDSGPAAERLASMPSTL